MALRPFAPETTRDPYPGHRRLLRRRSPYHEPDLDTWIVSRHSDIAEILRDPQTFSSAGATDVNDPSRMTVLVNNDPPRHTRLRALVQRPLTQRLTGDFSTWVGERISEILDSLDPGNVE